MWLIAPYGTALENLIHALVGLNYAYFSGDYATFYDCHQRATKYLYDHCNKPTSPDLPVRLKQVEAMLDRKLTDIQDVLFKQSHDYLIDSRI